MGISIGGADDLTQSKGSSGPLTVPRKINKLRGLIRLRTRKLGKSRRRFKVKLGKR